MKTANEKFIFDVENGNPGDFFFLINAAIPEETDTRMQVAENIFRACGFNSVTVDLRQFEAAIDLRVHLESLKGQDIGVVHLVNADTWFMQKGYVNTNICRARGMNKGRDAYYHVDFRTVLWLSEATLDYFSTQAVDFYSWRTGAHRLEAPPPERDRPHPRPAPHKPKA